jgi:hypothetical protein
VACVETGSQKAIWEVTEENGAYVRGMRSGITSAGAFFKDYTLEFDTKIDAGGIGWTVVRKRLSTISFDSFTDNVPIRHFQLRLQPKEYNSTWLQMSRPLSTPTPRFFGQTRYSLGTDIPSSM